MITFYVNEWLAYAGMGFLLCIFVSLSTCHTGTILRLHSAVSPMAGGIRTWVLVSAPPVTRLLTNHWTSLACTLLISEMRLLHYMIWQASSSSETHWWGYLSWRGAWQSPLFSPRITDIIQNPPQHECRCGLSVWQRLLSRGNYWVWQRPNPGFRFWDVTVTSVVANGSNFSSTYMFEYAVLAVIAWELFFF